MTPSRGLGRKFRLAENAVKPEENATKPEENVTDQEDNKVIKMSKIVEYFESAQKSGKTDDRILSDNFFGLYQERGGLRNRLDKIRRDQLDCCGARPGSGSGSKGAVELFVLDKTKFDSLNVEYTAVEDRITEIDDTFRKFDSIAAEAEKIGLKCAPTPYGLERARVEVSNEHYKLRRKIDATTKSLIDRRIPAGEVGAHPQIVELEIAMGERKRLLESIEALLVDDKEVPA
jgi:hypothetical protein